MVSWNKHNSSNACMTKRILGWPWGNGLVWCFTGQEELGAVWVAVCTPNCLIPSYRCSPKEFSFKCGGMGQWPRGLNDQARSKPEGPHSKDLHQRCQLKKHEAKL